jgi:hypothetical protein
MRYLLWAEGPSDVGLCEVLNWVLAQHHVDVTESRHVKKADYPTLDLLLENEWAHLLFLHLDADADAERDGKGPQTRRQFLTQQVNDTRTTLPPTVCVVPVQESEAWLLAHKEVPLASIEAQTSPKEKLKSILEAEQGRTLTQREFSEQRALLWAQLVRNAQSRHRLEQLPAFQRLVTETTEAIQRHGLTQH